MIIKNFSVFSRSNSALFVAVLASFCVSATNIALAQPVATQPAKQSNAAPKAANKSAVADPVTIKLDRKKVTIAEGKEVLLPATTAKPGEMIEETATYTNPSKKNTRRLSEATLPVPQYTEPILSSIKPANVMASTDGKTFAAVPLKRKVRQANGVVIEQPVPLTEYRFLRWSGIDLAPEKQFVATARFKLNESPAAVEENNTKAAKPTK
jgi:hypothetical protein